MKEAHRSKLAADLPRRIIDQNAETLSEIGAELPYSMSALIKFARAKIDSGEWEKVWKKVGGKLIPAYRHPKR